MLYFQVRWRWSVSQQGVDSSEAHPLAHPLASCAWCADLKEELAQAQGSDPQVQEDLTSMPESQLAAVQQQHTADMLQAVAEYVGQEMKSVACHTANPEDSLAAIQRRYTLKLINEVTHYLQMDMQHMQQMCEMISVKPVPCSLKELRTSRDPLSTHAAAVDICVKIERKNNSCKS